MNRFAIMTAAFLIGSACLSQARADQVEFPTATVLSTHADSGPSFTLNADYDAGDVIAIRAEGIVHLSPTWINNAAGILVEGSNNPGGWGVHAGHGYVWGALLLGNSNLGFHHVFPQTAEYGLGNVQPPSDISIVRSFGDLFGSETTLSSGSALEWRVYDWPAWTSDNAGAFVVSNFQMNTVPVPAAAMAGLMCIMAGLVKRRT